MKLSGQDAWNKFVREFSGLVMWSVKAQLAKTGYSFTTADIEDIHQEVFISLYNGKLKQLKDESKLPAWLAIISGGIAVSYMRQKGLIAQKSVSLFDEVTCDEGGSLIIADTLEDNSSSLYDEVDKKFQQEALAEIIKFLNPAEKIILNLYFIYENGVKEIAQNLDLAQGTVASIIARAKDKLKQRIKKKEGQ